MHFPPEFITALIGMLPITEIRGAIPVGVYLGLSLESAFFWALLGNTIPLMVGLWLLKPISQVLMKHSKWFHKFFSKIFEHTRDKFGQRFEKVGAIFLISLTSIPLPGTGAYTGAILAFLFDVPYWHALAYLFIGMLISGGLVTLGVGTATHIPDFLNFFIGK